jgi:hypothetical protein
MSMATNPIAGFAGLCRISLCLALACAVWMADGASPARAQEGPQDNSESWPEVKCQRYKQAWSEALARRGTQGLGQEFLDRHEAFLASGCTARADVCPRSPQELDLANIMVILAMNAGTASTFPPFFCRK